MLDALTDNPQDFVEVSGTALAAGVCMEKRWGKPAASAVPLTEHGAVLLGSVRHVTEWASTVSSAFMCRSPDKCSVPDAVTVTMNRMLSRGLGYVQKQNRRMGPLSRP